MGVRKKMDGFSLISCRYYYIYLDLQNLSYWIKLLNSDSQYETVDALYINKSSLEVSFW